MNESWYTEIGRKSLVSQRDSGLGYEAGVRATRVHITKEI